MKVPNTTIKIEKTEHTECPPPQKKISPKTGQEEPRSYSSVRSFEKTSPDATCIKFCCGATDLRSGKRGGKVKLLMHLRLTHDASRMKAQKKKPGVT